MDRRAALRPRRFRLVGVGARDREALGQCAVYLAQQADQPSGVVGRQADERFVLRSGRDFPDAGRAPAGPCRSGTGRRARRSDGAAAWRSSIQPASSIRSTWRIQRHRPDLQEVGEARLVDPPRCARGSRARGTARVSPNQWPLRSKRRPKRRATSLTRKPKPRSRSSIAPCVITTDADDKGIIQYRLGSHAQGRGAGLRECDGFV